MLICIGAPLAIAGIVWGLVNFIFLLRATETTGTIVGETSHRTNKSGTMYRPIVEFQGPDGKTVQFTERLGSTSDSGFIIGVSKMIVSLLRGRNLDQAGEDAATVRVVYDPNKPSRAHIKSFQYLFLVPTILIVAGAIVSQFDNPAFLGFLEGLLKPFIDGLPK